MASASAAERDALIARRTAKRIRSARDVAKALQRMADEIGARLAGRNPIVLAVMQGGVFAAVELSKRFRFAHEFDYVHLTRYANRTKGGAIEWRKRPGKSLAGRTVLVVDDVLDRGHTLRALHAELVRVGVAAQQTAVLVRKKVPGKRPRPKVDYVGIEVDDLYVFGCGMDYRGHWRGLPALYALDPSCAVTEALALIVGSGFAKLGLPIVARSPTKTPYGAPSSAVLTVTLGSRRVACIARHGEDHVLAPNEIDYRANLWALQQRGVRSCIGINTVGAIADGFAPGDLAVPDQLIDYTSGRASTYGGEGRPVAHVDFTEPFAPLLRGRLAAAVADCGFGHRRGVYGVTQGPRLETAAEIDRMGRDGCAMVGMTAMPEAALARELGIDYAICALAVNYAAGRAPDGAPIGAQIERFLDLGLQRVAAVLLRLVAAPGGDFAAETV